MDLHPDRRRPAKRGGYHLWSRQTYELFAAPLLLWLPEEYTDVGPKGAAEKLLDPQGPLGTAVESALRFLTHTSHSHPFSNPKFPSVLSHHCSVNLSVLPGEKEFEVCKHHLRLPSLTLLAVSWGERTA